jgi:flagellar P-ring protein precursor FlgI
MISRFLLILAAGVVVMFATPPAHADRVKDLASLAAVRSNQLVGYGIVVGLPGTGDGADISFTVQTVRAMMNKFGVGLDGPLTDFERITAAVGKLDVKNVAAVMVTAELPGMSKPGQRIDVNVSTLGKASSLRRNTSAAHWARARAPSPAKPISTSANTPGCSTKPATLSRGGTPLPRAPCMRTLCGPVTSN